MQTVSLLAQLWVHAADHERSLAKALVDDLHGPPKESKFRRCESLKGLLPYIRAVCADGAAVHDGLRKFVGFLEGSAKGKYGSSGASHFSPRLQVKNEGQQWSET